MRIKVRTMILVGIAAALIAWVLLGNLYWMREDSSGQLLWKGDEAYLFAMVARRGLRIRAISFPWEVLGEWLNVPAMPTEELAFLTVIRVTPSGIERHTQKGIGDTAEIPVFFTPIGEIIYAGCHGTLCKWVGDHFENASLQEQKSVGGFNQLSPDIDGPINGWSKRGVGSVVGDFHYAVDLGNDSHLRIQQGNVNRSVTDSATVYLDRAGRPSQQLWHVDGTPRLVSRWKYKQAFSNA
jgi:hypothetical protein